MKTIENEYRKRIETNKSTVTNMIIHGGEGSSVNYGQKSSRLRKQEGKETTYYNYVTRAQKSKTPF